MLSCITVSYKNQSKISIIQLELATEACYFTQYLSFKEPPLMNNLSGDPHETI
jgi:hypothetical protein